MVKHCTIELAGRRLDARPGHGETESSAAELAGQSDILGIATHEVGRATAEGLPTLPLLHIPDVFPVEDHRPHTGGRPWRRRTEMIRVEEARDARRPVGSRSFSRTWSFLSSVCFELVASRMLPPMWR